MGMAADVWSAIKSVCVDSLASAVTNGQDKVSLALTTGDNKIEAVLLDTKTSLDNIKGSVDVQNERILNGLTSVATYVKDAGVSNKDALADVSLKIKENADNVKQAGVDNKVSLDDISLKISTAGANNKDSLNALASAVTTGEDKVAEALNVKVTDALDSISSNVKATADNVDLNNIHVSKKLGGTIDDSELIDGLCFVDKKASHSAGGPTRIENAKIGLIQFPISAPKSDLESNVVVHDYTAMDRLLKEERKHILELVKKILATGANVLLL